MPGRPRPIRFARLHTPPRLQGDGASKKPGLLPVLLQASDAVDERRRIRSAQERRETLRAAANFWAPTDLLASYSKLFGHFAPLFWAMVLFCFVIPFPILAISRTRTIAGTLVASISVNIGMWLERFTIVVPSPSNPRAPVQTFFSQPSWVEWSLMAGCFAAFGLLYMGFTKLFPIISVWELDRGAAETVVMPAGDGRLKPVEA